MGKTEPIKRSKDLIPLSRDHHDGLLLCWKINTGINKGISMDRISAYILHFYYEHLEKHFEEEEAAVFTLLHPENPDRKEAELHHRLIREMIDNFKKGNHLFPLSIKYFAEILELHIRYEERILFNIIEKEAEPTLLRSAGTLLTGHVNHNIDWHDQFWLKENTNLCSQKLANTA